MTKNTAKLKQVNPCFINFDSLPGSQNCNKSHKTAMNPALKEGFTVFFGADNHFPFYQGNSEDPCLKKKLENEKGSYILIMNTASVAASV